MGGVYLPARIDKKGGPEMDAGPYPSCNSFILTGTVSGYGTLPA